ncbi:O-antigen ligase family protein [Selenihalanaerobacter shriftii]|uniref:O-antigen ligase n=1 Tax=Selenihalanaerobacter shriftii TaxID=142842 RepID=A0A1T4KWC8_9FIRM|nr:O-antigen ligase family protein [Selenihalanaerobacter shriftii]SJZ46721.1 O-antigen ligase [Selenihalanaerobacter shriftii]
MKFNKEDIANKLDRFLKVGLYVWVFMIPVSIGGMNTMAGILFFVFLFRMILKRNYNLYNGKLNKAVLSFTFIILLSSLTAYESYLVIDEFISSILSYLLIYYLIVNLIKDNEEVKKVLSTYWVASIIAASYAGYSHFINDVARASGFTHNPNRLGATMMMFIIFNFALFLFKENKKMLFLGLIGIGFGFLGLVASVSRGALIATFIGTFIISLLKDKRVLILFIVGALLLGFFLPQNYKARLEKLSDFQSNNVQQRWLMYKAGLKIFKEQPLLGIGFNNIELIYDKYNLPQVNYEHVHLHNLFINVAVEMGMLGVVNLLFLLYIILKKSWVLFNKKQNFLIVAVIGIINGQIFYNLVDTNYHAPEVALIFIVFISLMCVKEKIVINNF